MRVINKIFFLCVVFSVARAADMCESESFFRIHQQKKLEEMAEKLLDLEGFRIRAVARQRELNSQTSLSIDDQTKIDRYTVYLESLDEEILKIQSMLDQIKRKNSKPVRELPGFDFQAVIEAFGGR